MRNNHCRSSRRRFKCLIYISQLLPKPANPAVLSRSAIPQFSGCYRARDNADESSHQLGRDMRDERTTANDPGLRRDDGAPHSAGLAIGEGFRSDALVMGERGVGTQGGSPRARPGEKHSPIANPELDPQRPHATSVSAYLSSNAGSFFATGTFFIVAYTGRPPAYFG
jgi:hypothetical protein